MMFDYTPTIVISFVMGALLSGVACIFLRIVKGADHDGPHEMDVQPDGQSQVNNTYKTPIWKVEHPHLWKYTSSEDRNGLRWSIYVCEVCDQRESRSSQPSTS